MAIINTGPATGGSSSVDEEEEEPTVDSSSSSDSGGGSTSPQRTILERSQAGDSNPFSPRNDQGHESNLNSTEAPTGPDTEEWGIEGGTGSVIIDRSRDEESDVGPQPGDPSPDQEEADAPDEGIPDPGEYAAAVEDRVAALQDAQRQRIGALVTRLRSQSGDDGGSGGLSMVIIIVAVLFSLVALAVGLGGDD